MLISTILRAIDFAASIDFSRLRDDAEYRLDLVKRLAGDAAAKR